MHAGLEMPSYSSGSGFGGWSGTSSISTNPHNDWRSDWATDTRERFVKSPQSMVNGGTLRSIRFFATRPLKSVILTGTDLPFVRDSSQMLELEAVSHAHVHGCQTAFARRFKGAKVISRISLTKADTVRTWVSTHTANWT